LFFSLLASGDDFDKLSREDRCQKAGGLVTGHLTKGNAKSENSKKSELSPLGPIDCTCGGKRFNPVHEGDICRDGKIMVAMERYCEDSHGTYKTAADKVEADVKIKALKGLEKKCFCGSKDFTPTAKTDCVNGELKN
jgi:hypothetical protein